MTTNDCSPACEVFLEDRDIGILARFETTLVTVEADHTRRCQARHPDRLDERDAYRIGQDSHHPVQQYPVLPTW